MGSWLSAGTSHRAGAHADMYEPVAPWQMARDRFEARYPGQAHPAFFPGSCQDALKHARDTRRLLVIYVHCPWHQDTDRFVRETLGAAEIITCLDSDFIVWMDDMQSIDGYTMAGQLQFESFPFLAIVFPSSSTTTMTVHARFNGYVPSVQLLTRLHAVNNEFNYAYASQRAQEAQHDEARHLRQAQDDEYQAALERDRRLLQEVEERQRKEESERMEREAEARDRQRLLDERRRLLDTLPSEPSPDTSGCVTVQIRLTDGRKLQRRFTSGDRVQDLYNWVIGTDPESGTSFELVSNYPRQVYASRSLTLGEAGLAPQCALFIQEL
ncbi:UBX domain-containing protein [Plasmodiophora brassicae]